MLLKAMPFLSSQLVKQFQKERNRQFCSQRNSAVLEPSVKQSVQDRCKMKRRQGKAKEGKAREGKGEKLFKVPFFILYFFIGDKRK